MQKLTGYGVVFGQVKYLHVLLNWINVDKTVNKVH